MASAPLVAAGNPWGKPATAGHRPRSHQAAASSSTKFTVLVVEDNRNDRELLDALLVEADLASVHYVTSGQSVIEYLAGRGEFGDRKLHPLPHVLLLDLAMPEKRGLEVLEWISGHDELAPGSVYILTASRDSALRQQAIAFGVAGYFQKPLSVAQISWILEDRMALMC